MRIALVLVVLFGLVASSAPRGKVEETSLSPTGKAVAVAELSGGIAQELKTRKISGELRGKVAWKELPAATPKGPFEVRAQYDLEVVDAQGVVVAAAVGALNMSTLSSSQQIMVLGPAKKISHAKVRAALAKTVAPTIAEFLAAGVTERGALQKTGSLRVLGYETYVTHAGESQLAVLVPLVEEMVAKKGVRGMLMNVTVGWSSMGKTPGVGPRELSASFALQDPMGVLVASSSEAITIEEKSGTREEILRKISSQVVQKIVDDLIAQVEEHRRRGER